MRVQPQACIIRKRVAAALASGLEGNERAAAERWLGGLRRLPTFAGVPIEVRFRELSPSHRSLMDTLGVTVIIDPNAPAPYVFESVHDTPQKAYRRPRKEESDAQ